jgi:hypothetical protein
MSQLKAWNCHPFSFSALMLAGGELPAEAM